MTIDDTTVPETEADLQARPVRPTSPVGTATTSGIVAVFGLLAAWSATVALRRPIWDRMADLHVYLGAVRAVHSGRPLYSFAAENGDPFTYPPFALLVFWPLGGLPEQVVRVVWTVATFAAVIVLAAALTTRHGMQGRRRLVAVTASAAAALLISAPIQSNLRFGQVSVFVVTLALVDAVGLLPRRLGGVLVGIAAAVKLTPLLFVPYLWVVGRRRDAVVAGSTFVAATATAFAVWPADSVTFWSKAIFTTSRIGDLAAAGNQSLNGVLLRYSVPTTLRTSMWFALAAVVCVVALMCAREYHRRSMVTHAAVVVGCATIAASPVSWTHHQIWTVLAGLLLIAGPRESRRVAGAVVLVVMSVTVGAVLPLGELGPIGVFLRDNVRALCAVAVCCGGVVSLWRAAPARLRLVPGVAVVARPRAAVAYCTILAVAAMSILVVTRDRQVTAMAYSPATANNAVWADTFKGGCMGYRWDSGADGKPYATCEDIVGAAMGGLQLNFSAGRLDGDGGSWVIEGEVGPLVARLVYIPVRGAAPITVPLLPEAAAPATMPAQMAPLPVSDQTPLRVVDNRSGKARRFAIATNDSSDALLFAYDGAGNIVGEGGTKLQTW